MKPKKQIADKNKSNNDVETTYVVESVDVNDTKTADDGTVLVRVKWLGYDEETFEPMQNVVVVVPKEEKKSSSKKRTPTKKVEAKKDNGGGNDTAPPASKRRKTEPTVEIDYMQHSLMNETSENANAATWSQSAHNDSTTTTALSSASSLMPPPTTAKRSNAARARRENISIEEQLHRSAEMRDLVSQEQTTNASSNATVGTVETVGIATRASPPLQTNAIDAKPTDHSLYYSSTDSDNDSVKRLSILFPYRQKQQRPTARTKKPIQTIAADNLLLQQNAASVAMLHHHASVTTDLSKAIKEENWLDNSALENANDEGQQPIRGAHVCHSTLSTDMQERNYKAYGINSFFRDTQFEEDVELERKLMGVAVRNLCRTKNHDETDEEALIRAQKQIESAGFGKALVSVHSLCASARARQNTNNADQPHNLTSTTFDYPLQTDVRCFYDHHRFTDIPIFIPLAFSSGEREMLSILSSVCFCSFSCAKSWIREKAPSGFRSDNSDIMLTSFARKYFGMTENIKLAQPLILHEDYGGPLTTRQWRAMGTTHHSILRQPLCVAAPSTVVAEVYVRSRKDVGKVARISRRTEETHFGSVPERPEKNSADAAEASKRKLKEGEGRPLKQRQTVDGDGNRVTLDDAYLDKRIAAGTALRNAKSDASSQQPSANNRAKTIPVTQSTIHGAKIISLPKKPSTEKTKQKIK